jgi:RHS repeat-associated protein
MGPNGSPPWGDNPLDDPCERSGSIIECQNQTLGEMVEVGGTPFSLHYQSDRTTGRAAANMFQIPLSGAGSLPTSLEAIQLTVSVAGRRFTQSFTPTANLNTAFAWDGLDAYGRVATGAQAATVQVDYIYPAVYQGANVGQSFGRFGNAVAIGGSRAAAKVTIGRVWEGMLGKTGVFDARGQGLGGWSLDVHHAFDPRSRTLYLGDGRRRSAENMGQVITTVAGGGNGDGLPATEMPLDRPTSFAVGPDQSLYIPDTDHQRILQIRPDGIITTVAGRSDAGYQEGGYSGDGGPATEAKLNRPYGVAVGPDGSLYIADYGNNRIRRVTPDGTITTVAGNGSYGIGGDGGTAAQAQLSPDRVAVGPDGSLYITDSSDDRVRRVTPDGIITTVAGSYDCPNSSYTCFSGDGGPATQAKLKTPEGVAVGSDGSLYIADSDNHRIRRVGPDGLITTVAGSGGTGHYDGGLSGNGGPATQAKLWVPSDVAVGADGSLYIADSDNHRIRRVGPDGIITTIVGVGGTGSYEGGYAGDGGPAGQAQLHYPEGVAVGGDGSFYIADSYNNRVRRVALNGIITTVAGNGETTFSGDGRPATHAQLAWPAKIAVGPDGSVYIADTGNKRVRRVGPDGSITTVAGNGTPYYEDGDGLPATSVGITPSAVAIGPDGSLYIGDGRNWLLLRVGLDGIINQVGGGCCNIVDDGPALHGGFDPIDIVVGPDGSLYIADTPHNRIRRIAPDGIITTVAGSGPTYNSAGGYTGDGGPATQAQLNQPNGVALGPDGSLYIADTGNSRIRRVGPDGIITTVAGRSSTGYYDVFGGDGGPATQARLNGPFGVALGPDGSLYIADTGNSRIRRVGPDGIITTVTGNDCPYGARVCLGGDGGPPTQAKLFGPEGIALGPDGSLYIADTYNDRIRRIASSLPGFGNDDILVVSEDGSEAYQFTASGRHLRTFNALTGDPIYTFAYDTAGRLAQVTDRDGRITTIDRDGNGSPTAIAGPDGQRTAVAVNAAGYATSITNPAGETTELAYADNGLLTSLTDSRNGVHSFEYDAMGRLIRDSDPEGGFTELARTANGRDYSVSLTNGLNDTATLGVATSSIGAQSRTFADPHGSTPSMQILADGTRVMTDTNGNVTTTVYGPDPRWGMQAPFVKSMTIKTASGQIFSTQIATRTVTLEDPNDLLSLQMQTDIVTVNGRTTTTIYAAATHTIATTSPDGQQSVTTLNDRGRPIREEATGHAPKQYTYDPQGRETTVIEGMGATARTTTYSYNAQGYLASTTDPYNQVTTYEYDAAGRVTAEHVPIGQTLISTYDAAGNPTSTTDEHGVRTTYEYDGQNQLIAQTYDPDGVAIRTEYTYDLAGNLIKQVDDAGAGRLNSTTRYEYTPIGSGGAYAVSRMIDPLDRTTSYTYTPAGDISSTTDPLGHTTVITYTSEGWRGTVTTPGGRTTQMTYNTDGQPLNVTDPAGNRITYVYDALGRQQQVKTGTTTTVNQTTAYAYDSIGRVISTTVGLGTSLAQTTTYGYDSVGRVITTTVGVGTELARSDVTHYNADGSVAETIQNYRDGVFDPKQSDEDVITSYGYDSLGRQVWVRDATGRTDVTHYDATGQVDWTILNIAPLQFDNQGQPLFQAFNPTQPDANIATLSGFDRLGRNVLITETGILTGTFDPTTQQFSAATGRVTQITYDRLSRPITVTLNYRPDLPTEMFPDVNIQTVTRYDTIGNVAWERDTLGRWTHIEYDALNRPITVTLNYENGDPQTVDPYNRAWTDGSDTDLVSVTRYTADGQVDQQVDNYVDGVFTATEPITDRITLNSYDVSGRPTTTTLNYAPNLPGAALNRSSAIALDPSTNRLVGQRDPLGRWVSQQYDTLGRVTTTIQNCRDTNGNPVAQGCASFDGANMPDRNVPTQTRYDALGRVFEVVNQAGQIAHLTFDRLSRPVAVTQNFVAGGPINADTNVTTRQSYDLLRRTTVVTDALGTSSSATFNMLGQTVVLTDTMGRVIRMGYDRDGTARWVRRPDGQFTVVQVDGLGRPITTIQNYHDGAVASNEPTDQDLATHVVYDASGRRIETSDADGHRTAFTYDLLDRLIGVTENVADSTCPAAPCNVQTRYVYDRVGNRIAIVDARGKMRQFTYDAANQQTSTTDALGRATTWDYDALGRVTVLHDPRGISDTLTFAYDGMDRPTQLSAPDLGSITAHYDALGRRQSLTDAAGTTSFTYDELGRMTQAQAPQTGTISYSYDARGQRTQITYPNNTAIQYAYWDDGRLRSATQGSTTLASYIYDPIGRISQVTRANEATTTYTYDGADRLTDLRAQVGGADVSRFIYQFNRHGLRTTATETLAGQTRVVAYTYDGLFRLASATEIPGASYAYAYDLVGNRTDTWKNGALVEQRGYDAADQVVGWSYDAAGNLTNDGAATYTYDALNRLTRVVQGSVATDSSYNGDGTLVAQTTNGSTTRYTQDLAADLSQILQATQGLTTTTYLYGADRLAAQSGTTRTWYLGDALGSVRTTLDDAGAPLATTNYDPWGAPEASASPPTFGFTGELQDSATGLVYLRARWYHATHGTFTSRDSFPGVVSRPASLHAYQYTASDPVLYTDPSGHDPVPGDQGATPPPPHYCADILNDPNCHSQGINWEAGAAYGATVGRTAWETTKAPVTTLWSLTTPQTWETMRRGGQYLGAHPFRSAFYIWEASISFYDDIYYGIKCDDSTRFAKGMTQLAVLLAGAKFQKDFSQWRAGQFADRASALAQQEEAIWAARAQSAKWQKGYENLANELGDTVGPGEFAELDAAIRSADRTVLAAKQNVPSVYAAEQAAKARRIEAGRTAAPSESGHSEVLQEILAKVHQRYPDFTNAMLGRGFNADLADGLVPPKAVGAKTLIGDAYYPFGIRVVLKVNGHIEAAVSDLDAGFLLKNGRLVSNSFFMRTFGRLINKISRWKLVDHGPHVNGVLEGLGAKPSPYLGKTVYAYGPNGFMDKGPMIKMLQDFAPEERAAIEALQRAFEEALRQEKPH